MSNEAHQAEVRFDPPLTRRLSLDGTRAERLGARRAAAPPINGAATLGRRSIHR
jgi:hypothetical protein